MGFELYQYTTATYTLVTVFLFPPHISVSVSASVVSAISTCPIDTQKTEPSFNKANTHHHRFLYTNKKSLKSRLLENVMAMN